MYAYEYAPLDVNMIKHKTSKISLEDLKIAYSFIKDNYQIF